MLRAIIGFDHIGKNLAEATWLPTCGYAITRTSGNKQLLVTSDGCLACATGSASAWVQTTFDLSQYMVPGINSLSIGVRFKTITPGNTSTMFFVSSTGADPQLIANFTDMSAAAQLAGGETYLEVVYNFTAGTYSLYWDDVFKGTYTTGTVNQTNLKAGKLVLLMEHTAPSSVGVTGIRDIVIIDDLPGDGITTRLGPRVCAPITVDVATGTDWTVSDGGSILNALNAALETGVATCTSGPSKAPLVVSLKSTIPAGANIDGIMLTMAGKVDVAGALTGVKLTNGATSINGQSRSIGATLKYGNPLGTFARAPDGSRWTASSIDSTALSLTPDVAS